MLKGRACCEERRKLMLGRVNVTKIARMYRRLSIVSRRICVHLVFDVNDVRRDARFNIACL